MMTGTLYNDTDPYCAQWLRNLITAGHITRGDVDDRDIRDLGADDVSGYRRCHFFAGIAGWDHALAIAGWPAARPVWTGSCPCQPFSNAGRQGGGTDERHLWPQWLRLIRQCRPDTILGEQVAGAVGFGWIDRVFADLEAEGYACGAAVLGAHSVGAPHIRQRLFWVADASGERPEPGNAGSNHCRGIFVAGAEPWCDDCDDGATGVLAEPAEPGWRPQPQRHAGADGRAPQEPRRLCGTGRMADTDNQPAEHQFRIAGNTQPPERDLPRRHGDAGRMGDANYTRPQGWGEPPRQRPDQRSAWQASDAGWLGHANGAGREAFRGFGIGTTARSQQSSNTGFWNDAVWCPCLDGKARRTQPGIHPLAARLPGDVGRLRAYGNAIVPQTAAQFIAAFMQTQCEAAA